MRWRAENTAFVSIRLLDSLGTQWMCSALINMMRMNKCGHRRNADITLPPPHPLSQRNIENTWEPSARSNKETPRSQAWSWATGENTKTERRRRSSVSRMAGGVVEGSKVKPWRSTFFYSIWVMHLKCETTLMEGTLWAWGHKPNFKTVPYDLFCLDSKRKPCSARNADSNFWSDLSGQMQTT